MSNSSVNVCVIEKTTQWISIVLQTAVLGAFCFADSKFEWSNLCRAYRCAYHVESTSLEKSSPSLWLQFPESISLLFTNWQMLVPINPLVISCGGLGLSKLTDRQLDYAVAAKTQHTWIKIVGWCHVTVRACLGRSLPGIVCPGVVSFYSLFKESSCWAAHDNSLQEGLWLLCIVSIS